MTIAAAVVGMESGVRLLAIVASFASAGAGAAAAGIPVAAAADSAAATADFRALHGLQLAALLGLN